MELKSAKVADAQSAFLVLIVPLWNWNLGAYAGKGVGNGFNCTFMELKSVSARRYTQRKQF